MSNGFKKFIDTAGKSFDEIKKLINNMVMGIEDNSSDFDDYKPEKIPPRLDNPPPPMPKYPPKPFEPNSIAYPHESIPENMSQQDEFMLDKIHEMRDLEIISHNSYIVKRCALDNLIIQGDFMFDVEDDFERQAFCRLDMPIYAAMSNSQLRTYFTWRTDVRRAECPGGKKFPETDKPYVILYCFELMNKIGGISSDEAFDGLCAVWENCRGFIPYLNRVMPRWIKDFYAFNNVSGELPKFPEDEQSRAVCLAEGDFSGKLELLADNSSYPIRESVFLTDETRPLMEGAIEEVLRALSEYFKAKGLNLSEVLFGAIRTMYSWEPFANALVDLDRQDGFREVVMDLERYRKRCGKPSLERFEFSPSRGIIGFILKSAESELRVRTGKGRKLSAKIEMAQFDIRNKAKLTEAVEDTKFPSVIQRAVDVFCDKHGIFPLNKSAKSADNERSEYVRTKVEIDVSKLAKIREESDELAKKLIIPEEPPEENPEINEEQITEISEKISEDDFAERTEQFTELVRNPEDDWQILTWCLTAVQIAVLDALMRGKGAEFCRERGLLPETVYEQINTAALEHIGDVIIEDGEILEDYSDEVAKMIKSAL